MRRHLLPLAALALLTACAPKSLAELGRRFTIQGVVLDSSTIATGGTADPLEGVTVTLISSDRLPSVLTDKHGSFVFGPVYQGDGMLLVFEKTGYAPITKVVPDLIPESSSTDGGCTICGPDGRGLTVNMFKRSGTGGTLLGRVINSSGAPRPLAGASVTLLSGDSLPAATADANGNYTLTGIKQLSNMRIVVSAAGYYSVVSGVFNIDPQKTCALPDGTSATPCFDFGDISLTPQVVITGTVTDLATRLPLAGVKVTLVSPDNLPAATTDTNGAYRFSVLTESVSGSTASWTLQFQKTGFQTDTVGISSITSCGVVTQGNGVSVPTCIYNDGMTRAQGTLAGIVRYGAIPAQGAIVQLCVGGESNCLGTDILSQSTLDATGRFSFTDLVVAKTYRIIVLPWDQPVGTPAVGDGILDTTYFIGSYGPFTGATDWTNLTINLVGPTKNIIASSLVSAPGYPWGVSPGSSFAGLLQDPNATFFLHFGAPVDQTLTTFELHQVEATIPNRLSPPLPITVTWDRNVIASIKPATPFASFPDTGVTYQIWITSLRWADGLVSIPPKTSDTTPSTFFTSINFSVYKLPVALVNPTPALYFGNTSRVMNGQVRIGTQAIFDNDRVYILDKNNDIVDPLLGNTALWNSTTGIDLQFPSVAGAVSYTVMVRNTIATGGSTPHNTQWVTAGAVVTGVVDPIRNPVVAAAGVNVWTVTPVSPLAGSGIWAFGNAIEIAVVCTDGLGFISPIDPAKILSTSDKWGGLVSAVNNDAAPSAPGAFATITEFGGFFTKSVAVTFTEPMAGSTLGATPPTPTISLASGALTLVKTNATAYGSSSVPSVSAPNQGDTAWFNLQFQHNNVPCTEVLAARVNGDTLLPVRDPSIFAASSKLVLMSKVGAIFAEGQVGAIGPGANMITLQNPMVQQGSTNVVGTAGFGSSAGDLACVLAGHGAAAMTNSSQYPAATVPLGSDQRVIQVAAGTAGGFFIGERVYAYEPSISTGTSNAIPALIDTVQVIGIDTAANTLLVSPGLTLGNSTTAPAAPATNGHTAATVLIPTGLLNSGFSGGEIPLRGAHTTNIVLNKDLPAGGAGATISIFPPGGAGFGGSLGLPLVVNDRLQLDNDGDISTVADQFVVTVTAVKCIPLFPANQPPTPSNATCILTLDATTPAGVSLSSSRSTVTALGDLFTIAGTTDTSGNASLNAHGARFTGTGGSFFRF